MSLAALASIGRMRGITGSFIDSSSSTQLWRFDGTGLHAGNVTDPRMHIRPPEWLKDVNAQILADPRATAVLTVAGRKTGTPRRTPVTLYDDDGSRYLVGGFPGADWVRNVRAADHAQLAVGGRDERVRLVELDATSAEQVLRVWPTITPDGVAIMRDAGIVSDITPDALAEVAGLCPVFRVERA
jgi:deazaflavin-dependent oxidoreductase (nitroreductase family)